MSRLTNEEKAIATILKAVSDINLDPGYLAMYLNQQLGPAKRVLDEVLYEAGYYQAGTEPEDIEEEEEETSRWAAPENSEGTSLAVQAAILGNLWINYRDDEIFAEFIAYNDLGLPLAYASDNGIIDVNGLSAGFIGEAFQLLLLMMEIEEDPGYESEEDFLADLEPWLEENSDSAADEEDSYDSHEDPDYEEPEEDGTSKSSENGSVKSNEDYKI